MNDRSRGGRVIKCPIALSYGKVMGSIWPVCLYCLSANLFLFISYL